METKEFGLIFGKSLEQYRISIDEVGLSLIIDAIAIAQEHVRQQPATRANIYKLNRWTYMADVLNGRERNPTSESEQPT